MANAPVFGRRTSYAHTPLKSEPLVVTPRPEPTERVLPGLKELGFVTVDDGAELRAWKASRRKAAYAELKGPKGWRLAGFALSILGVLAQLAEQPLAAGLIGGAGSICLVIYAVTRRRGARTTTSDGAAEA